MSAALSAGRGLECTNTATGTQVTYDIKNGGNAYGDYFTSNQWNEIQTANMVITFTKNDKTN
ncbi:MAG: hypothetical protein J6R18_09365, partial [Kiritimatiellae bacterium]|nr:hypothetical protein [Kiritimatiellia bacterium]